MIRSGWAAAALLALVALSILPEGGREPMRAPAVKNPVPWIPAQCWAEAGPKSNSCFVCHQTPRPPNFIEDAELQLEYSFARPARRNPWRNVFDPPPASSMSDEALRDWVRRSNYVAGRDADCWFQFDAQGFDHRPTGALSGWRAFAYSPVPGAFLPVNGSDGDAMIRLPLAFRQDASGVESVAIYRVNLAILEAFIRRADVELPDTDEVALGVDLDGDGRLGRATRVGFQWPYPPERSLRFVGGVGEEDSRVVAGLFPRGTEFLHTVRYFEVANGEVRPAVRMKEVRRMRKDRWLDYGQLEQAALAEAREKEKSPNALRRPRSAPDGMHSGTGWVLQGLIEDRDGALRPQTNEEVTSCIGCHGGVGANTDSTFSFARKLPGEAGWRYATKAQLRDVPEPVRADGEGEYTHWLRQTGGAPLDGSPWWLPTPARALALNRAYLGLVKAQAFTEGRDVFLDGPRSHRQVESEQATGVVEPLAPAWVRPPVASAR